MTLNVGQHESQRVTTLRNTTQRDKFIKEVIQPSRLFLYYLEREYQLKDTVFGQDFIKYSHSCFKTDSTFIQSKHFSSSNDQMLLLWKVIVDTQQVQDLEIIEVCAVSEDFRERALQTTKKIQTWYKENIFYEQLHKPVSEQDWDDIVDKDKKPAQFKESFGAKELSQNIIKPKMSDRSVQAFITQKSETFEAFIRERGLNLTLKEFYQLTKIYPYACLCLSKEINSNVKVAIDKEMLLTWEQIKKGDTFIIKIYHLLLVSSAFIHKGVDLTKLIVEWAQMQSCEIQANRNKIEKKLVTNVDIYGQLLALLQESQRNKGSLERFVNQTKIIPETQTEYKLKDVENSIFKPFTIDNPTSTLCYFITAFQMLQQMSFLTTGKMLVQKQQSAVNLSVHLLNEVLSGAQQDSSEYFIHIIQSKKVPQKIRDSLTVTLQSINICLNKWRMSEKDNEIHFTDSKDTNFILSLGLKGITQCDLQTVVDEFFALNQCDNYLCEICQERQTILTKALVAIQSDLLIVQVKLFDDQLQKIQVKLEVQDILKVQGMSYELVGFVQHFGTINNGHYTYSYKQNSEWFQLNDNIMIKSAERSHFYFGLFRKVQSDKQATQQIADQYLSNNFQHERKQLFNMIVQWIRQTLSFLKDGAIIGLDLSNIKQFLEYHSGGSSYDWMSTIEQRQVNNYFDQIKELVKNRASSLTLVGRQTQEDKFSVLSQAVNNKVEEWRQAAMQEKIVLHVEDLQMQHYNQVSSVSMSVDPDHVNSKEATEIFADFLSCSNIDYGGLSEVQSSQLKQQAAEIRSLKEKIKEYQLATIQERNDIRQQLSKYKGKGGKVQERRKKQIIRIKEQFEQYKEKLDTTEDWLTELLQKVPKCEDFKEIGCRICDAIVLHRFALVFGDKANHDPAMKAHFIQHGVRVKLLYSDANKDLTFIQLTDEGNSFTEGLINSLVSALKGIREKLVAAIQDANIQEEYALQELAKVYIIQIDYTQDFLGFFASLNVEKDLDDLEKLIGCLVKTPNYNQLATCFQFVNKDHKKKLTTRLKVYNKSAHLLTSGQFKKWLNMNLHKLLKPSQEFYVKKLQPAQNISLKRIEASCYCYSVDDWEYQALNFAKQADDLISRTAWALNQMRDRLCYKVSLSQMIKSYFETALKKVVLIAFENDTWAIAYKYTKRSYTFTGHLINKTSKSGSRLNFILKYLYPGQRFLIFMDGKPLFNSNGVSGYRGEGKMQLPIATLNYTHRLEYHFELCSVFAYHLTSKELSNIRLKTGVKEVKALLHVSAHSLLDEEDQVEYFGETDREVHPSAVVQSVSDKRHILKRTNFMPQLQNGLGYTQEVNQIKRETGNFKAKINSNLLNKAQKRDFTQLQENQQRARKRELKEKTKEGQQQVSAKISYDLKQKRNFWEVVEADWIETKHRQGKKKIFSCIHCQQNFRSDNRMRHNCQVNSASK